MNVLGFQDISKISGHAVHTLHPILVPTIQKRQSRQKNIFLGIFGVSKTFISLYF